MFGMNLFCKKKGRKRNNYSQTNCDADNSEFYGCLNKGCHIIAPVWNWKISVSCAANCMRNRKKCKASPVELSLDSCILLLNSSKGFRTLRPRRNLRNCIIRKFCLCAASERGKFASYPMEILLASRSTKSEVKKFADKLASDKCKGH